MKKITSIKIILTILFALILVGCTQSPAGITTPLSTSSTSRPVIKIDTSPVAKSELAPKDVAELAFNLSGQVMSTNVEIGDIVEKGDVLIQLDTTTLDANVVYAESNYLAAQAELDSVKKQNADMKTPDVEAQNIATDRLNMAEADLVRARYMLTQATLIAPFSGTIVDVQVAPGEIVTLGKVVVTMADMNTMQVETLDLTEMDISRIYIDQPVEVYVEALDMSIDGNVSTIVPQATLLGEEKVFKVIIHLKSQPQNLRWGMSAETKFIVDE